MEKIGYLFLGWILSMGIAQAQPVQWQSPIAGSVLLSGTFGELRGSHYHAGIDIKPNVTGPQDVLAVSDGFVKEIRIRGGSYGNALILQHPDGYLSLYGHLNHFIPELNSLVYDRQFDEESFEVSIELDSTQFPVTRGMKIATMGNTGYSFGRHLHFEVRHPSGTRYNPLLVIPELNDDSPPQFRNLKINYHDEFGREYQEKNIAVQLQRRGQYTTGPLVLNSFRYSIGVDVVDLHQQTHNRNGIYKLEMYRDTSLVYYTVFDSLTSDDRKYYPEHIDYVTSPEFNAVYHNMRYTSNDISTQLKDPHLGLIRPFSFQIQEYKIIATDYQGNSSTLTFSIRQVENPSIDYDWMYNYVMQADRSNRVNLDQFSIIFPEGTFVRDQRLYIFEEIMVRDGEQVVMVHMNEDHLPLYENPLLVLKSDLPLEEKSKWTLARCSGDRYSAVTTIREADNFASRISRLSSYCLIKDTIAPVIEFLPQNNQLWYFKVSDDMHSFSSLEYRASVNGQWALVEADTKNNRLIFRDFRKYPGMEAKKFVLSVTDACGNEKNFEREFK